MRDTEGRICVIYLNVFPFKCNSPQTDDKRSSTIPQLLSFFSEATKERGDEERGGRKSQEKKRGKKREAQKKT